MENVQNIDENCWKSVQKQLKILWKSGKCGILISEKLSKRKGEEVKTDVRETHRAGNP